MSQTDQDQTVLSETTAEQGKEDSNLKLVPVAESIRYRKRAQSAEKEVEALAEALAQAKAEAAGMAEQLSAVQLEQKLIRKLVAAGTVDVETAVLIAKARVESNTDADLDGVVEQLKREKRYLFIGSDAGGVVAGAKKTSGAKDRIEGNQTILEKAAEKAATTGSRTDLQEYLRLRRNFI